MRRFIFDSAGSGKTKRALDITAEDRLVIVICPASVIDTWLKQTPQWSDRTAYAYRGTMRGRMLASALTSEHGLLAMSYEMTHGFRVADLPKNFTLIVDESHYVKNPRSQRSQAVRAFSDRAERVLLMTGTPTRKDLEDLYGQCNILYPKRADRIEHFGEPFASLTAFRKAYGTPSVLWINGVARTTWSYADSMASRVASIIAGDVLPVRLSDMEAPDEEWIPAPKTDEELQAFMKWDSERELTDDVYAASASAAAGKLAQLDDGFAYDVDGRPYRFGDSKMRAVIDYAERNDIKRLLVWCRYKASAEAFLTRSDAMLATEFLQSPRDGVRFIIGNFQSMGTGVDGLQKLMSQQCFIDLPYTSADYEQAIARLVRRGQRDTPRLYVVDTLVNRRIMEVIQGRMRLDEITHEPLAVEQRKQHER